MNSYMYKRNNEGIHIINPAKAWEKLMIAARIIAAVSNPKDILVRIFRSLCLIAYRWLLLLILAKGMQGDASFIDRFKQRVRTKSRP